VEFSPLHYDFHPAWVGAQLRAAGMAIERRRSVSLLRTDVLKRHLPASALIALDGLMQRVTAPLALGPSQFVRARVRKAGGHTVVGRAHLFRCPTCSHEPLSGDGEGLICAQCGARWPVINGVYVFKS
jgi:hypothetical protein